MKKAFSRNSNVPGYEGSLLWEKAIIPIIPAPSSLDCREISCRCAWIYIYAYACVNPFAHPDISLRGSVITTPVKYSREERLGVITQWSPCVTKAILFPGHWGGAGTSIFPVASQNRGSNRHRRLENKCPSFDEFYHPATKWFTTISVNRNGIKVYISDGECSFIRLLQFIFRM